MKHFIRFFLFFTLALTMGSCNQKGPVKLSDSNKKEVALSKFAQLYPDFNPQVLKEKLQVSLQNDSVLNPFYTSNEFALIWVHDTLDTKNLYNFIDILDRAKDEHGLSAKLFPLTEIKSITDSIYTGKFTGNMDVLYAKMVDLEQVSTKTAIKYIKGMKYGFVNPKQLYKKEYDITVSKPDSTFFDTLSKDLVQDPIAAVLASHPTNDAYLKLQAEYKMLESKKEKGFNKINSGDATYKLGDKNKHISEIAERLMLTGEYAPDTVATDSTNMELDEKLLAAINTFRKKNSYPEEQEVGKLTVDALNRPLEYYQEKLRANMERFRWQRNKAVHAKHIEVNVASAMLIATNAKSDSLPLISKVCIGSATNRTPLLESDINYVNLNPVWNVPSSIAQKEVAVLQKKDPTYIKRKNMKLFKGGKEVDVESIDWKEVNPNKFSYMIRQDAGGGNSLGLVKFMFNNNHSVYLHDTPMKAAFKNKNRAVSHGCIRVQRPFDLAFFCLSPVTDVYKDQLYYSINMPPQSAEGKKLMGENKLKKLPNVINIDPENKISLFVDYYTAFISLSDDSICYADDTYNYDSPILVGLGLKEASVKEKGL